MASTNRSYEASHVDRDRLFKTLREPQRRRIITALQAETSRWIDEFESEECRPAGTERTSTAIDLHHRHLPQLEEAGFIEWDRTTDRITRGEHFDELQPLLDIIDDLQAQPKDQ